MKHLSGVFCSSDNSALEHTVTVELPITFGTPFPFFQVLMASRGIILY
jgi:hypothetical protein